MTGMESGSPRGLRQLCFVSRWKVEDLEMLAGRSEQAGGTTPSLPKQSSAPLEAISVPVTGSGSPVTAEIKPSFSFSRIPCPCRCRALSFHPRPSWFWKVYNQFLSRPMHMQFYFRKMMLGALWLNPDTENAP